MLRVCSRGARDWLWSCFCTASFIAVVDTTIVSIALPSIRRSLGFSTPGVEWVLNAYALSFAGPLGCTRFLPVRRARSTAL